MSKRPFPWTIYTDPRAAKSRRVETDTIPVPPSTNPGPLRPLYTNQFASKIQSPAPDVAVECLPPPDFVSKTSKLLDENEKSKASEWERLTRGTETCETINRNIDEMKKAPGIPTATEMAAVTREPQSSHSALQSPAPSASMPQQQSALHPPPAREDPPQYVELLHGEDKNEIAVELVNRAKHAPELRALLEAESRGCRHEDHVRKLSGYIGQAKQTLQTHATPRPRDHITGPSAIAQVGLVSSTVVAVSTSAPTRKKASASTTSPKLVSGPPPPRSCTAPAPPVRHDSPKESPQSNAMSRRVQQAGMNPEIEGVLKALSSSLERQTLLRNRLTSAADSARESSQRHTQGRVLPERRPRDILRALQNYSRDSLPLKKVMSDLSGGFVHDGLILNLDRHISAIKKLMYEGDPRAMPGDSSELPTRSGLQNEISSSVACGKPAETTRESRRPSASYEVFLGESARKPSLYSKAGKDLLRHAGLNSETIGVLATISQTPGKIEVQYNSLINMARKRVLARTSAGGARVPPSTQPDAYIERSVVSIMSDINALARHDSTVGSVMQRLKDGTDEEVLLCLLDHYISDAKRKLQQPGRHHTSLVPPSLPGAGSAPLSTLDKPAAASTAAQMPPASSNLQDNVASHVAGSRELLGHDSPSSLHGPEGLRELAQKADMNPEIEYVMKAISRTAYLGPLQFTALMDTIHEATRDKEKAAAINRRWGFAPRRPPWHVTCEYSSIDIVGELTSRAIYDVRVERTLKELRRGHALKSSIQALDQHIRRSKELLEERGATQISRPLPSAQAVAEYASPYGTSPGNTNATKSDKYRSATAWPVPREHHPSVRFQKHPDSRVGADFHSVPYPLTLLPFRSWKALHNSSSEGAVCASCSIPQALSPQQEKLFLVAERLSWGSGPVSVANRTQNEETLWAVNAELEIFEPAVEDEEIVLGGRQSKGSEWFPFRTELEMEAVMTIVAKAEVLTERSWELWKQALDRAVSEVPENAKEKSTDARKPLGESSAGSRWLPSDFYKTTVKGKERAIIEAVDLSSGEMTATAMPSYVGSVEQTSVARSGIKTLQDFYSILDKLERTSKIGARYLEAYAERLQHGVCRDCWVKQNTSQESDEPEDSDQPTSP